MNDPAARDHAIAQGQLIGTLEADARGEVGIQKNQRVARAAAYAAWDHDGRPDGPNGTEFGVRVVEIVGVLDRSPSPRLIHGANGKQK